MQHHPTIELAQALIRCRSLTPDDAGAHSLIAERLTAAGFHCTEINRGNVKNLWASFGPQPPALILAGHTDVVPTGDLAQWQYPPFDASLIEGELWGQHLCVRGESEREVGDQN